jgi:hypothetical protein
VPAPDGLAEASIGTERLVLSPLRVADAEELAGVLGDPALHEFIGERVWRFRGR